MKLLATKFVEQLVKIILKLLFKQNAGHDYRPISVVNERFQYLIYTVVCGYADTTYASKTYAYQRGLNRWKVRVYSLQLYNIALNKFSKSTIWYLC